jgi:predicted nucleic acid-binding protein
MKKSKPAIRTFLLDTNVLIAAIKDPRRQTSTLRLLLVLIKDPSIKLVGNDLLAEEMLRYAELLKSETAAVLVSALFGKMEIVRVSRNHRKICRTYIRTPDIADVLHAATCLQTGAVLITNDKHFDRIKKEGVIEVLSVGEAIKELL